MPTVMRIDLRSPPPHYTLTRDPDRVVRRVIPDAVASGASATGESMTLAQARATILSDFERARQEIIESTRPKNGPAQTHKETLDSIAASRKEIFDGVRGDGAGPVTIPRWAPIDLVWYQFALQRGYSGIAALEMAYAEAMQAALQVDYDASTAAAVNGTWLVTNGLHWVARMESNYMRRKAVNEFNAAKRNLNTLEASAWPDKKIFSTWL